MKTRKRGICFLLCLSLLLSLAACGGKESAGPATPVTKPTEAPVRAMGRYVEEKVDLPEGMHLSDMVVLNDGRLRVSLETPEGGVLLCTTGPDRGDWVDTVDIPEEVTASGDLARTALSPDGTVFCHTVQFHEEGFNDFLFWIVEPDGACRELPIEYPNMDENMPYVLVPYCDFTASGKLMLQFYFNDVREVDLATGELGENLNELEPMIRYISCAGDATYLVGVNGVSVYRDGETKSLNDPMGEQLAESMTATQGGAPKLAFWQDAAGYQLYTTHEGIFSFIPGGTVTEELVSGARCSLGDPGFYPTVLAGAPDDSFYVLGRRYSGGGSGLYHYVYDPDVPTVPDTQMKLYTLRADDGIQQMVSAFQTAHQDVAIDIEVGIPEGSGISLSEALRTLNTKILAGEGPDILCLDGFNLTSYREKGLLADLSGVLAKAGPTLETVTRCFAADGQVCALPTLFVLPAACGPQSVVDAAHDWETLTAATAQAYEDREDAENVMMAWFPKTTADQFYDSCSAAWQNADGTVNEEAVTRYFTGLQGMYALDSQLQEKWAERRAADIAQNGYKPGNATGMIGSLVMHMGGATAGFGTLDSMWALSYLLAAEEMLDGFAVGPQTLGGEGVFLPRRVMGILADSGHKETAEEFLLYMLSDDVQAGEQNTGFPVNRTVLDKELDGTQDIQMAISGSDREGNMVTFHLKWPDAARRQQLRSWIDGLTAPALTDWTIRSLVLDQAEACLMGDKTAEEAAAEALREINLYLVE